MGNQIAIQYFGLNDEIRNMNRQVFARTLIYRGLLYW